VSPPNLYESFHECPAPTAFNVLQAGAAVIHSFTVNGDIQYVALPNDTFQLEWDVSNASRITLERVGSFGPLLNGATTYIAASSGNISVPNLTISNLTNTPGTAVYRLTAVGLCGNATKTVIVVCTQRPNLAIAGAEVTQGIQSIPATVRLVEHKPTIVRVTVRHGLNGWGGDKVPNVIGRIRVLLLGTAVSPWIDAANGSSPMSATPGTNITVPANPARAKTDDTLNFKIPSALCGGQIRFQVEVRVSGFDARAGFVGHNEEVRATTQLITFEPRRILDFRYVRVNWGGATPTPATCASTLRGAIPLLPTPTAIISPLAGQGVYTPFGTQDTNRALALWEFWEMHNCDLQEAIEQQIGSDCPQDDGSIWVLIPGQFYQGRAYIIGGNVCFTPPNDPGPPVVDRGPYAAHELSHCLRQWHVSVPCANGQTAQNGDTPAQWPNGGQVLDVPFNVSLNSAVTSPTGVWDVMTYCGSDRTWPSLQRWQRLWDEVGQ
jgi:hypothetical protein